MVLMLIPRKVITVTGGVRFSSLVTTPRELQSSSIAVKVVRQVGKGSEPAIRKSSR